MLEIKNLNKQYDKKVLKNINIKFKNNGLYLIRGVSGCGKSSLLNIIGGLDKNYEGEVIFEGMDIKYIKDYHKNIGFIFQCFFLMDFLSGKYNAFLTGFLFKIIKNDFISKLLPFKLNNRLVKYSGGQKQRIAICRALNLNPKIILCDEPTGSLDYDNSLEVMKLLKEKSKQNLVIVVSHDHKFNDIFDTILDLEDGTFTHEKQNTNIVSNQCEIKNSFIRKKPLVLYSILQCFSRIKINIKIVSALCLGMFSVLMILILSDGFVNYMSLQIEQMFPSSTIAIRSKVGNLSSKQFEEFNTHYENIYCDIVDFEFLGISSIQNDENVLFIGDITKQVDENIIIAGNKPINSKDVVLSDVVFYKLFNHKNYEEYLNTPLNIHYLYLGEIINGEILISGICKQNSILDNIYFEKGFNVEYLKTLTDVISYECNMFLIDIKTDPNDEILKLEDKYSDLEFKVMSIGMQSNLKDINSNIQTLTVIFSTLVVLSACFLLGQVMMLSVEHRKKEIALLKCIGASKLQIISVILIESLIFIHTAFIVMLVNLNITVLIFNDILLNKFNIEHFLNVSKERIFVVYIISFMICICCTILPCNSATKTDVIEQLR